jgi:hypothetical protein
MPLKFALDSYIEGGSWAGEKENISIHAITLEQDPDVMVLPASRMALL